MSPGSGLRPDRALVRDIARNLLLVGLGFSGGVILPNEKPLSADLHWMEQVGRRLAADDARAAILGKVSGKVGPGGPAVGPAVSTLAPSGAHHALR